VSSLAGHQKLGNLITIWDDNQISIEDDTTIAKSEERRGRYEAYGWHVQRVDWRQDNGYHEDVAALYDAILAAKAETGRPSFIALRTIIGWPAPNKQNTGKIHGSALGAEEVAATKRILGLDPDKTFLVTDDVLAHAREVVARGRRCTPPGRRVRRWRRPTPGVRALQPTLDPEPAGRLDQALPEFAPTARESPRARRPVTCSTRSARCCPSCGAARPTWLRAPTPRSRAIRPSSRPSTRRRCSPATGTAGRSTSESASTAWARSSTASCCTAAPARTARRS
jgi:transketolase